MTFKTGSEIGIYDGLYKPREFRSVAEPFRRVELIVLRVHKGPEFGTQRPLCVAMHHVAIVSSFQRPAWYSLDAPNIVAFGKHLDQA